MRSYSQFCRVALMSSAAHETPVAVVPEHGEQLLPCAVPFGEHSDGLGYEAGRNLEVVNPIDALLLEYFLNAGAYLLIAHDDVLEDSAPQLLVVLIACLGRGHIVAVEGGGFYLVEDVPYDVVVVAPRHGVVLDVLLQHGVFRKLAGETVFHEAHIGVQVLFGRPDFVAPEVYTHLGVAGDVENEYEQVEVEVIRLFNAQQQLVACGIRVGRTAHVV